jgi:hypothetical protein
MSERVPPPFVAILKDLAAWLDNAGIPAIIVGGVAAAVLGRPRATRDIDALALIAEDDWPAALAAADRHGIGPRIDDPLSFARRTRVLLLRHLATGIDIDVILGRLPFEEEAVSRGQAHTLGGVRIKLPRVEDLLIMKAVAQRPQDLRDIEGLLDAHPEVDVDGIRDWVRQFAAATSMPDLAETLDKLLGQRAAARKPSR